MKRRSRGETKHCAAPTVIGGMAGDVTTMGRSVERDEGWSGERCRSGRQAKPSLAHVHITDPAGVSDLAEWLTRIPPSYFPSKLNFAATKFARHRFTFIFAVAPSCPSNFVVTGNGCDHRFRLGVPRLLASFTLPQTARTTFVWVRLVWVRLGPSLDSTTALLLRCHFSAPAGLQLDG